MSNDINVTIIEKDIITVDLGHVINAGDARWGDITGTLSDQTDLQNALDNIATEATWGDIVGTLSNQADLQAALDAKYDASNPAGYISGVNWGDIGGTLNSQTDLQNALDGKVSSVVAGTNVTVDNTDPQNPVVSATTSGGQVDTVVGGNNITVDSTDPANPIVSVDTLTLSDISDVTATATEVNFTGGVTSPIQSQLNDKLENITGLVTQGTNVTITGSGTSADPYVVNATGTSGVSWGDITGTLSAQADLQTALDAKADVSQLSDYVLKAGDTMTGTLIFSSGSVEINDGFVLAAGSFNESTTVRGFYGGLAGGTPRFMLANGTASQNFQFDNLAGTFRVFTPGATHLAIDSSDSSAVLNGSLQIGGALAHQGNELGFYSAAPVVQDTGWSVTSDTPDRDFDADTVTLDELADVVGTLVNILKAYGILGA